MADGFSYGGTSGLPHPFWLTSPSPHPPTSTPPFLAPVPVYLTQGGFDPMISHASYHQSPADWSNNPSYGDHSFSQTPSSSFYADNNIRLGNFGPRGEDSYKNMFSPSGYYPVESSGTLSSSADMLIRNSQESFYKTIPPSGVYASSGSAFHENRPGQYHHGYDKPPESMNAVSGLHVEPCLNDPVLPQALFDGSQTGLRLGDGKWFPDVVSRHAPEIVQSTFHGSSVEPVNFDLLLGYGEATGHIKPLYENPYPCNEPVGSTGSRSSRASHPVHGDIKSSCSLLKEKREGSGVSSLYQTPKTFVADSENGVSETSLKNTIDDLNCEGHRSWNHFMVSSEEPSAPTMFSVGSESCVAMNADNGNAAPLAVNCKTPSDGNANQPSEDVQASEKTCKLQGQMFDMTNRDKKTTLLTDTGIKESSKSNADDFSTGQSPKRHLCDQGGFLSPASFPTVSSVVNAMHNLSDVLVNECFNSGSLLKPKQLENLDKVVENLTKCLKKITGNKTLPGDASISTQPMHVSCLDVADHNEASNVVAKDCQGLDVKPLDSFGLKEPVDEDNNMDEMTQSIKNILASKFPDGEENHPQTLLYKSLWLETEAALCSTNCMTRYNRIKNEAGNLKLQNREISADASTFMQEHFLNPQKPVSIMNNVEQETTDSLIKHGSNSGNGKVTMSHDAPQSSRFNSEPVNALLSLMSRSFMGGLEQEHQVNFKPDAATSEKILDAIQQESPASTTEEKHNDVIERFQILKHQETKRKLKSQNCPNPDIGVIDRFQILKQQEPNRKVKSQNCSETRMDDQEENPEALEVANICRISQMSDRFKILKRQEAEQVQEYLNNLDRDSDSDNDQPRDKHKFMIISGQTR